MSNERSYKDSGPHARKRQFLEERISNIDTNNPGKLKEVALNRVKAISSMRELIRTRRYSGEKIDWEHLGPTSVNYMNMKGIAECCGRITGIEFGLSPSNIPRFFLATSNGGVWYTEDNGWHWTPLMDNIDTVPTTRHSNSLACGAISTNPSNQKEILVGTGEGNRFIKGDKAVAADGLSYHGIGPVRGYYNDSGDMIWDQEDSDLAGHAFFELAWDPNDSNRVIGATTNGLYLRRKNKNTFSWVVLPVGDSTNHLTLHSFHETHYYPSSHQIASTNKVFVLKILSRLKLLSPAPFEDCQKANKQAFPNNMAQPE
ncbi:MAG: hypothetical protein ACRBF0_04090 [Calditrichia bacterium]